MYQELQFRCSYYIFAHVIAKTVVQFSPDRWVFFRGVSGIASKDFTQVSQELPNTVGK